MKNQKEKIIEKALKTGGFIFPQTVNEVKEFERLYGATDVILPTELESPTFLDSSKKSGSNSRVVKFPTEDFAMAAREGSNSLPPEVKQKIVDDIKASEAKKKRKNRK